MANKYSQIFQSQFVPQYQPPNVDLIIRSAGILQGRQQQGMEQYDALQESLNQLDVMESDKQLLQERREKINQKLSQFSDENDFIDALPAIRKEARNLQKEMQEGPLGDAIMNKQNAMETFSAIDESDWSPTKKEQMKQMYLSGYDGAGSGQRLDVWTPPEYANVAEEIGKAVSEIEETTTDTIGVVPDEASGGFRKAKVRKQGRNRNQIENTVITTIAQNPKVYNALATEARLNGLESEEEVSKYIQQKANSLVTQMQGKYGPQSETFSNIQWDGLESVNATTQARQTSEPGILQSLSTISDLSDHMYSMRQAKNQDDEGSYSMLKNDLDMEFTLAMEAGEISREEYKYFMDNLHKKTESTEGFFNMIGEVASDVFTEDYGTQDQRLQQISTKLDSFIEESGGRVSSTFLFEDKRAKDNARDLLADSNPQNFDVVSDEFTSDKDEEEKLNYVKDVVVNGDLEGISFVSDDAMPMYKYRYKKDDDSPWQTVFLREKSTQNITDAGHKTPFEEIVNTTLSADAPANQLLGAYKLHNIPTVGENVYEQLPPEYRHGLGDINYLGLTSQEGGQIVVDMGTEDDHQKVTDWEIFNLAKENLQQAVDTPGVDETQHLETFDKFVRNSNTLLESEKTAILNNIRNLGDLPADVARKLKNELDKPRVFDNKIDAINFARRLKLKNAR